MKFATSLAAILNRPSTILTTLILLGGATPKFGLRVATRAPCGTFPGRFNVECNPRHV